jgi:hypothetical protein
MSEIRRMGVWSDSRGHYECPVCLRVNILSVTPLQEGTVVHDGPRHTWIPYQDAGAQP